MCALFVLLLPISLTIISRAWQIPIQNNQGQNYFWTWIPPQGHHVRIWCRHRRRWRNKDDRPLDDTQDRDRSWSWRITSQSPIAAPEPPGYKWWSPSQDGEEKLMERPAIHGHVMWLNLYPPSSWQGYKNCCVMAMSEWIRVRTDQGSKEGRMNLYLLGVWVL